MTPSSAHTCTAMLLLALCAAPTHAGPPAHGPHTQPAAELLADGRALAALVACTPDASGAPHNPAPKRLSDRAHRFHCRRMTANIARFQRDWLAPARAFFADLVPPGLPDTVVYPFGGADLLNALAVFPEAREITTLSLERAGDPRGLARLTQATLKSAMTRHRLFLAKLLKVNHNRTIDLAEMESDALPAPVVFALTALQVHAKTLVGMRAFRLADDGAVVYLTDDELDGSVQPHIELRFRAAGHDDAPLQVFRHIYANLSDTALAAQPAVLAHLRAKGRVTAMTKAASYLLWRPAFTTIRGYLLDHMAWMISDSTGIAPYDAEAAGFEQQTWGRFDGVMFSGPRRAERAMASLWARQPRRKLSIYFGYPDKNNRRHLLVTRPKTTTDAE